MILLYSLSLIEIHAKFLDGCSKVSICQFSPEIRLLNEFSLKVIEGWVTGVTFWGLVRVVLAYPWRQMQDLLEIQQEFDFKV